MRKAKPKKRVILPDPVFNDKKVSKFVNHLMYNNVLCNSFGFGGNDSSLDRKSVV